MEIKERYYEENGKYWYESTLIKFASDKKNIYKKFSFEITQDIIEKQKLYWKINNIFDFIVHMKKIDNSSLKYPIILTPKGKIADGVHRISKAYMQNSKYIEAVQLNKMPKCDFN